MIESVREEVCIGVPPFKTINMRAFPLSMKNFELVSFFGGAPCGNDICDRNGEDERRANNSEE